MNQFIFTPIFT